MYEIIDYDGWPNCIRLYNDTIEVIVTTAIGLRIVKCGFIGKQNFLYLVPAHKGTMGGNDWRIYGGHRLWLAPEAIPFSYNPDNEPVEFEVHDGYVKLIQAKESITGIVKEMEITMNGGANKLKVMHRLINKSEESIVVAPWPITMLIPGGTAVLPQEPFGEGDDYLLPARSLALWHFTKMNDPRWIWGEKYIQAKQDTSRTGEQKIGITNKQGWMAYCLKNEVLIKKIDFDPDAVYPDYNCNNEIYINADYLEMETLGPLSTLAPGGVAEHTEYWLLTDAMVSHDEESIDNTLLPLLHLFINQ